MSSPNTPRVIIVGAGPAGSATACHLARVGIACLLIDRKPFPRDKICGDCLSPRAQQQLDRLGLLETVEAKAHAVTGIRFRAPNGGCSETHRLASHDLPNRTLVIPRTRFDQLLQQEAVRLGARFLQASVQTLLDDQLHPVQANPDRKIPIRGVLIDGQPIRADWVVLATGAALPLLKQAGLAPEPAHLSRAARLYAQGTQPLPPRLQFFFDELPLPGYAWLFPTGPSSANIGFWYSGDQRIHAPSALSAWIKRHPTLQQQLGEAVRLDASRGHPIRTDFLRCRKTSNGVLVVGEAAGLVNPFTGEGIDYGLESGALAATAIQESLDQPGRLADEHRRATTMGYEFALDQQFRQLFQLMALAHRWGFKPVLLNRLFGQGSRHQALIDTLIQVCFGAAPPRRLIRPMDVLRLLYW